MPLQRPFRGHPSMPIPEAKRAYETAINIPSSTDLDRAGAARVGAVLRRADLVRALL